MAVETFNAHQHVLGAGRWRQLRHRAVQLGHYSLTYRRGLAVILLPMNSETTQSPTRVQRVKTGGGLAFHSRLEPHIEFIRQQRRQSKTWKEIAERLHNEKGCPITLQGVHQFYRRYLRRCARPHWERNAPSPEAHATSRPANTTQRKTLLAATPAARPFRQPSPDSINLNDPSTL